MRQVTDPKFTEPSRFSTLKNNFRKLDIFGSQVNFSYKYQETYKTMEGATMTVILVILMVAITASQFSDMINRTSQVLTT